MYPRTLLNLHEVTRVFHLKDWAMYRPDTGSGCRRYDHAEQPCTQPLRRHKVHGRRDSNSKSVVVVSLRCTCVLIMSFCIGLWNLCSVSACYLGCVSTEQRLSFAACSIKERLHYLFQLPQIKQWHTMPMFFFFFTKNVNNTKFC